MDELEAYLRPLLRDGFDGEVTVRGHDTARICLYEGRIPWTRSHAYPEHLGDVLRRELGLPDREEHVQPHGGRPTIAWSGADTDSVFMTGPATTVFEGQIDIPDTLL